MSLGGKTKIFRHPKPTDDYDDPLVRHLLHFSRPPDEVHCPAYHNTSPELVMETKAASFPHNLRLCHSNICIPRYG